MDATAVELATFEIDPTTEEAMLAARPAAVAAIRSACGGLIDARLFRGEKRGEWIDVWFWASLSDAKTASEIAVTLPEAQAFFAFITSPPSMVHGTLVSADLHV